MIQIDTTPSPIQRILKDNIQRAPLSVNFNQTIYNEVLSLVVVDKKDKSIVYVTDGHHTILVLMGLRPQEINHYPLNRLENKYYTFEKKVFAYLNFTAKTSPPSEEDNHPYNPHYYFKDDYTDFIVFRQTYKLKEPHQRLIITQWNLALVNINASGYYAPALVARKLKRENTNKIPKYLQLNCILYQQWVKKKMEWYRLQDIRTLQQNKFPPTHKISLFYFLRLKRNTTINNCSLVAIDKAQHLLRYNQQQPKHYLLIGNLKGTLSFVNSHGEINQEDIQRKKLKDVELLFNGLNLHTKQARQRAVKKTVVWSDSQEEQGEAVNEERDTVVPEGNGVESEDQDGDILKNLYMKSMEMKGYRAI